MNIYENMVIKDLRKHGYKSIIFSSSKEIASHKAVYAPNVSKKAKYVMDEGEMPAFNDLAQFFYDVYNRGFSNVNFYDESKKHLENFKVEGIITDTESMKKPKATHEEDFILIGEENEFKEDFVLIGTNDIKNTKIKK